MSKLDSGLPPRPCANCGRPFLVPPSALGKRFCSDHCRDEWHMARRREAMELLRQKVLDQETDTKTLNSIEPFEFK